MRALALLAALAVPAPAAVTVASADLQVSIAARKGRPVFHTLESLLLPPESAAPPVLRALLRLDNDGARAEPGVVIRFALSARIKRVGAAGEGAWTVPFLLEERHVPRVSRGKGVEVPLPINHVALGDHLKDLRAAGYWTDALRLDVVLEPRRGEDLAGRGAARTVPVDWKPEPAKGAP